MRDPFVAWHSAPAAAQVRVSVAAASTNSFISGETASINYNE